MMSDFRGGEGGSKMTPQSRISFMDVPSGALIMKTYFVFHIWPLYPLGPLTNFPKFEAILTRNKFCQFFTKGDQCVKSADG